MKAILVIDMPQDCLRCPCYRQAHYEYLEDCKVALRPLTTEERDNRPSWCPLKPVHALKSAGKDYVIYERQYLYDNLEREMELMKKAREFDESNISN